LWEVEELVVVEEEEEDEDEDEEEVSRVGTT
jgi:hypothetical protein